MVDENIPMTQRTADLRLTNVGQREANAPLMNETDHENELLGLSHTTLQHLGIGNNSDREEENSAEEDVEECLNKSLLLDKFQQLINQPADEPQK